MDMDTENSNTTSDVKTNEASRSDASEDAEGGVSQPTGQVAPTPILQPPPAHPGSSSFRQSEELEREMRNRAKNRSRQVDSLERSLSEEEMQYSREMQREKERQAERERLRKVEAARKRREIRKRKLDEHAAMVAVRDQAMPIPKRKLPIRNRDIGTMLLVSSTLKDEGIASSSSTKPPSPPQLSLMRVTCNGYYIGPLNSEKCPYCVKEPFSDPVEAVVHIVDHGGIILDVQLSFYDDDKFLATEVQIMDKKCNACEVNFEFPTQYYMHLLLKHRMDVADTYRNNYPKANNVIFTTVLIFRLFPEHKIEFREIIPGFVMGIKD